MNAKKFNSLIPSNSVENFEEFRNCTIIIDEYERVIDEHSRNQKKMTTLLKDQADILKCYIDIF